MNILFTRKKNKDKFLKEFYRVKNSIKKGVTPVFSEVRSAKTTLTELPLYLIFQSILLIVSTLLIAQINIPELFKIAVVLIINTTSTTIANSLLIFIKHRLRIRCLKRFGLEVNEDNLAVLECFEYQSV